MRAQLHAGFNWPKHGAVQGDGAQDIAIARLDADGLYAMAVAPDGRIGLGTGREFCEIRRKAVSR